MVQTAPKHTLCTGRTEMSGFCTFSLPVSRTCLVKRWDLEVRHPPVLPLAVTDL